MEFDDFDCQITPEEFYDEIIEWDDEPPTDVRDEDDSDGTADGIDLMLETDENFNW